MHSQYLYYKNEMHVLPKQIITYNSLGE